MPVLRDAVTEYLQSVQPASPGLYIEPGIQGVIIASVYDAAGNLIREDQIASEHFDQATLNALTEWANRHQVAPPQMKLA